MPDLDPVATMAEHQPFGALCASSRCDAVSWPCEAYLLAEEVRRLEFLKAALRDAFDAEMDIAIERLRVMRLAVDEAVAERDAARVEITTLRADAEYLVTAHDAVVAERDQARATANIALAALGKVAPEPPAPTVEEIELPHGMSTYPLDVNDAGTLYTCTGPCGWGWRTLSREDAEKRWAKRHAHGAGVEPPCPRCDATADCEHKRAFRRFATQ